jgi:hypothetical protein
LLLALASAAALVLTISAAAAPPERALFVPGESLAGVRIGMTKAEVTELWGNRYGVCRDCPHTTWYFNYRPFEPEGAGVVLERGEVTHAFTVWQPRGWRTREGLELGEPAAEIARTYGPLDRRECSFYYSLLDQGAGVQTVYYVFGDEVWGFGLTRPESSPCL